jgi:DNA polymerase-3 subunit epsilon
MTRRLALARALALGIALPVAAAAFAGAAAWAALAAPEREQVGRIVVEHLDAFATLALALLVFLGIATHALYHRYVEIALAMADEIALIIGPNRAHRLAAGGPEGLRRIAAAVNHLAQRLGEAERAIDARVQSAVGGINEERNRLAALMSELAQCVLVCNSEGRILLYNAAATALIDSSASPGAPRSSRVGLGRSIFTIIGRERIAHAREAIAARLAEGEYHPRARFVIVADGRMLRAQLAAVLNTARAQTGYVVMLEDVTREVDASMRADALLQSLTEGSRASLAHVRAASEALRAYPDMDPASQRGFIAIINDEAEALSERLDRVAQAYAGMQARSGPAEEIDAGDLVHLAVRRIEEELGIEAGAEVGATKLWLNVDSYAFVAGLALVARRLRDRLGVRRVAIRLSESGRLAHLDVCWRGAAASEAMVREWEAEPLSAGPGGESLRGMIEGHRGDAWCLKGEEGGERSYRIAVPFATGGGARRPAMESGRPAFYDFDLFHQRGQSAELDERALGELTYTVFDTETTGLEPARGDEIVSIGAVRIVNARLLEHETFDQLVDPRRASTAESLAVHGLDARRLEGQPGAEVVLPRFHDFCGDTVLVAHNAAFDMRFLQMKEAATGLRFDHPVLDTLLLSAVVHPNASDHSLEAIALRLGIEVSGRHTALGDAMLTARAFLRMVPLLAELGIDTLGEARAAAQDTFYARLTY